MNETFLEHITVAPTLSDPNTLVIYRGNGQEIVVIINNEAKSIRSEAKLDIEEVDFIRENYL
jgi:hypothetical protein